MLWLVLIIVILGLLAVAAYVIYNRNPRHIHSTAHADDHSAGPRSLPITPSSKYWGKRFEIPIPENACAAARALDGQAFALGRAPALPLSGCDHVGCQCHLVPLLDRRAGEERRAGHERRMDIRFDDNKVDRRLHARRKDDDNYNWHYTA
jgi:hypothetical protein